MHFSFKDSLCVLTLCKVSRQMRPFSSHSSRCCIHPCCGDDSSQLWHKEHNVLQLSQGKDKVLSVWNVHFIHKHVWLSAGVNSAPWFLFRLQPGHPDQRRLLPWKLPALFPYQKFFFLRQAAKNVSLHWKKQILYFFELLDELWPNSLFSFQMLLQRVFWSQYPFSSPHHSILYNSHYWCWKRLHEVGERSLKVSLLNGVSKSDGGCLKQRWIPRTGSSPPSHCSWVWDARVLSVPATFDRCLLSVSLRWATISIASLIQLDLIWARKYSSFSVRVSQMCLRSLK